jgi:spore maturation protein B
LWSAVDTISKWAIPLVLVGIPIYGAVRGVKVYEAFTEGAKDAFATAVRLIPFLVGMLVAVSVWRESGAMRIVFEPLRAFLGAVGLPPEVVSLGVVRPISGSGALGMLSEILKTSGPDSLVGRTASTLVGSTETTLYVVAVYFGSVGVRKVRHSLAVGLLADAVGVFVSVVVCRMVFGS